MGKPSLRQQIRDLTEALATEVEEHRVTKESWVAETRVLHDQITDARLQTSHEQLMRVSAQRGLVAYMKEHGLGDQIGYDPDQDITLSAVWGGRKQT